MSALTRRSFLEHTLVASATGLLAARARAQQHDGKPAPEAPGGAAPADRVGVAVVGLHGRGMEHVSAYAANPGAEVVALCDVDDSTFAKPQNALKQHDRTEARTYRDLRKMLEDPRVQAVSIATPNHWHALASVWAMQAGKDVYVEKPVSHNLAEGRRLEGRFSCGNAEIGRRPLSLSN